MATREEMQRLEQALQWADKPKSPTRKTVARDQSSRIGKREHEKERKGKK